MTVVPLVVAVLITGVVTGLGSQSLGRLGARALVTFAVLLVLGGLIALAIAPPLLARLPLTPDVAARLQASATSAASSTTTAVQQLPSLTQRIVETIPANPIRAAADGAMLPLVIFTLVLALAIARLAPPLRDSIVRLLQRGERRHARDRRLGARGGADRCIRARARGRRTYRDSGSGRVAFYIVVLSATLAGRHGDAVRARAAFWTRVASCVRGCGVAAQAVGDELAVVARGAPGDAS
jgi:hypothetical protein